MPYGFVDGYIVDLGDAEATTTISASVGGVTYPRLVLGYETSRESRNVVHDLIGGGIAVALVAPRPRSGDLRLFYPEEVDAWGALELHSLEAVFTLTEASRPAVGMTYVVNGSVSLALDDNTRKNWVVTIPYQEVLT